MIDDNAPGRYIAHHPDRATQEAYWDWWQDTNSINEWALYRSNVILSLIRAHLRVDQPQILDFGCGNGWFSLKLADLGHVTAIDLSSKNIELAKATHPYINFIAGDVHSHPLPSSHFDLVLSQQVVAHVDDPQRYIDRAAEVMKPGGYLVISTNNRFVLDRMSDFESHRKRGHLEHWLTMRELKRLVSSRFRVVVSKSIMPMGDRGILRVVNSPKLNHLASLLLTSNQIQAMKEKAGLGYINIIVAKKVS